MAAESGTTLNGLFKTVYADTIERMVPEDTPLQKDFPFVSKKTMGKDFQLPVRVRRSGGQTYATGATALTAFSLNAASPGQMANATVTSQAYMKRVQVPYFTDFRSANAKQAFAEASDELVMDAKDAMHFDLESVLLYGQSTTGVGAIASVSAASSNCTVTVTAATWGAGLFTQAEGQLYDIYDSTLSTKRTAGGAATMNSIDVDSRGCVFACANGTDAGNIAVGDIILPYGWYAGSSTWNTMAGMDKIITNTGSLFGIDAATYGLWKASSYSAGNQPLTMTKLGNACIKALVKGGRGEVTAYVSPYAWSDINNDTTGLRRFTESTKSEVELGTQRLKFYGPTGTIEIVAHICVKAGEAFVLQGKSWGRYGSSEPTFGYPGEGEGGDRKFVMAVPDIAGYEFRTAWDQAVFCKNPARQVKITNIMNSSGP